MSDEIKWYKVVTERPCSCRKCSSTNVVYRIKESFCGGYEDYQYKCEDCNHTWWFDGIDS